MNTATLIQKLKSPPALCAAVLLLGLWLRWPLPEPQWQHIDEQAVIDYPLGFWSGDLNPHFFNYPTFHLYLLSLLYYIYYLLFSSEPLAAFVAYRYFVDGSDLIALARAANTLMAVGTVAVAMRLGQRLYGPAGACLAGLILALMPLHVRFSHLAITDVPASFWLSLALLWAVRLLQEGRRADYVLAGLFAGLAGATKYPAALVTLPVLGAAWWRAPGHRKRDFLMAGATALLGFALATPYVWLDSGQFWTDFSAMGQEHLLDSGHRGSDPSWFHLLRYNLRYGLGLAGLLTLAVALCWRPRAWRAEERVLAAALVVFAVLLIAAQSAFMRYSLPLATPAAVLMVRPLLSPSRNRLILAGWLLALLAEPAHASLQTRLLLGGSDTRARLRQWLQQHPEGTRIIQGPGRAGRLMLLSPLTVYIRQSRFIQSFDEERLSQAYESLSRRSDLPPFYLLGDLKEIKNQLVQPPQEAAGTALLLWCRHPLCGEDEEALAPLEAHIRWQEEFSPGAVDRAVFDWADWYFLPIGGWGATQETGPAIRAGTLPLRLKDAAPTAREFFQLLHQLAAARQAAIGEDWGRSRRLYQAILAVPFHLEDLLTFSLLYEMYMDLGMACQKVGAREEAIRCWTEAARAKPALAEPYHRLGITYSDLGQHARAAQYYQQAVALDPDDPEIFYNAGVNHTHLQQFPEAIAAFERCLSLKAEPDAYVNLGVLYQRAGQPEKARACFRKALELAPDHPQAEQMRKNLRGDT